MEYDIIYVSWLILQKIFVNIFHILKSKNIIERANLVENIIKRLFFLIRLQT